MLTLLAESKTMLSQQQPVTPEQFLQHTPLFEKMADDIMAHIEELTPSKIAEILGISNSLAVKAHNLAYDFPHKQTGYQALYGYTGEAFRVFDATTLTPEAVKNAVDNLRFISSVYGILKADDIIKPYRCEYNKPVAVNQKTPVNIFKPKITVELVKLVKENKIQEIINLLPGDADKCIDWKIVRAFTKVHKICFLTISGDGKPKTPIAKRLKELRGLMARKIMMEGITTFEELTRAQSDDFIFSPDESKPLLPVFIAD